MQFTSFYKIQHSDITAYPTTAAVMLELAGLDVTDYFPVPFTVACPGLVTSSALYMQRGNFTPVVDYAVHTSGPLQTTNGTKLNDVSWYDSRFSPYIEQYYKGQYVFTPSDVQAQADDGTK
jgi:chitin synthase